MDPMPWLADLPNEMIAGLDPLGLDHFFEKLPRVNTEKCVDALRTTAGLLGCQPGFHAPMDDPHALAAMRDLGFLAGSLQYQGVSVADEFPELHDRMRALGRQVHMVPRDTVLHYTVWNPADARRRTFTGDPQERRLIEVTGAAVHHVEEAIRALSEAARTDPATRRFAHLCTVAAEALEASARYVLLPDSGLDPVHFATVMRFYFEPMLIADAQYHAPAAAQVPLYLVDQIVRGYEYDGPEQGVFRESLALYGLPRWRQTFRDACRRSSLLSTVERAHRDYSGARSARVRESAEALGLVLRALTVFRGRHRRVVRTAYAESIRSYTVGSAGADVAVLDTILGSTRACAHALGAMTNAPGCTGNAA
ncbi:monodechloroaminopyrrolnitrin synthase PrnB family protein [Streptomyces sp. NPDC047097]|uniref:monodechloroaminopyrrolnitrin synthase PrnB family protein n=1 Tax=Streptomyces sp. NPDC047097 TaxID=3155260 RepID=UPI0033EF617B